MQFKRHQRVAIIGGGVCGLTAALRLAESGIKVELFEAAPQAGGRTRSFMDKKTGEWCDNGPHLLNGAYLATAKLLADCGASENVTWQTSLKLPLWDQQRQHFSLRPSSALPFPLALLLAVRAMPDHSWHSALAMLRLNLAVKSNRYAEQNVAILLRHSHAPAEFIRDMIEPICLGAMNESVETANADTFGRVLAESFASRHAARLGWFNAPLQQALVEPLVNKAEQSGVIIHTRHLVHSLKHTGKEVTVDGRPFDAGIIALPAYARNRLLDDDSPCETGAITNVHFWYQKRPELPEPFIGGIGTLGQWFFDISSQMKQINPPLRHLCAVISADQVTNRMDNDQLADQLNREFSLLSGITCSPSHIRIVREKRATVLVRPRDCEAGSKCVIDASESPIPGELPATIEGAVQRGEKAALDAKKLC